MFPLILKKSLPQTTSVQVPWANTDRGERFRVNHLEEALKGKKFDIIADTEDYRIIFPYTLSSLSHSLIGLPLVLDTGKEDIFTLFKKGIFPYIVEYSNTMGKGLVNYTKALVLVGNDNLKIFTGTSTARTTDQFLNDAPTDDPEQGLKVNSLILNAISIDFAKRKVHPFHEIQDTSENTVISKLLLDPNYIVNLLSNDNLTPQHLMKIVDNLDLYNDPKHVFALVVNHPSVTNPQLQSRIEEAVSNDVNYLIILAKSAYVLPHILDSIFKTSLSLDDETRDKLFAALAENQHTRPEILKTMSNYTKNIKVVEKLLNNPATYDDSNLIKKLVKLFPEFEGLALKKRIMRAITIGKK